MPRENTPGRSLLVHSGLTMADSHRRFFRGVVMPGTDQIKEDEVLRRMLNTPHESHKPLGDRKAVRQKARERPE